MKTITAKYVNEIMDISAKNCIEDFEGAICRHARKGKSSFKTRQGYPKHFAEQVKCHFKNHGFKVRVRFAGIGKRNLIIKW